MAQCIIPRMVPRLVRATSEVRPCIIYADGAFEDGKGTWGAILCDTASDARSIVHGTVPQGLIDAWVRMAGEQVICEIEAFAFLMARLRFREGLTDRLGLALRGDWGGWSPPHLQTYSLSRQEKNLRRDSGV